MAAEKKGKTVKQVLMVLAVIVGGFWILDISETSKILSPSFDLSFRLLSQMDLVFWLVLAAVILSSYWIGARFCRLFSKAK